ncbi:MAG: type II secretion system F family protein, partial [Nitrososphaera sp.]|nr:type II secretion system F family protein [Nitrososphaera sp.]
CPRDEALRHLVRRCGSSAELKGLVSHIIQAEKLGSSLAHTLRIYANTLRFKRREDTKELIQKLPVKLAFPLTFCILPSLFVVILGPSVLRIFIALTSR